MPLHARNILQRLYPYGTFTLLSPSSSGGDGRAKAVYLTFDDGPVPEVTPRILDILSHYGVKATFFMVGENIDRHSALFRRVIAEGHSVGNHTYNHLKGFRYSLTAYLDNIKKCQEAIERHDNSSDGRIENGSLLFRPPYGKAWLWQRRALAEKGYRLIYWDVLTRDYNRSVTPEQIMRKIKRNTRNGSIINFHDSLKSCERTLAVLPQTIEWLQAQGYSILPL